MKYLAAEAAKKQALTDATPYAMLGRPGVSRRVLHTLQYIPYVQHCIARSVGRRAGTYAVLFQRN